jgi:hypothetical protein
MSLGSIISHHLLYGLGLELYWAGLRTEVTLEYSEVGRLFRLAVRAAVLSITPISDFIYCKLPQMFRETNPPALDRSQNL